MEGELKSHYKGAYGMEGIMWSLKKQLTISSGLCSFYYQSEVKVIQSHLILCDPKDYRAYGILQARILEWVAFPVSRGSSQPRDQTQVSCIAGGFFTSWDTREAQEYWDGYLIPSPANLPNPGIEPGSPALQTLNINPTLPFSVLFIDLLMGLLFITWNRCQKTSSSIFTATGTWNVCF